MDVKHFANMLEILSKINRVLNIYKCFKLDEIEFSFELFTRIIDYDIYNMIENDLETMSR